jgi:TATA-box binding protein (TBP) (component of TFIID and TFIIIB)
MDKIVFHVYEGTYAETYANKVKAPYEYREFVDTAVASGTCGENATWTLYVSGKMVISGSGAMYNYTSQKATPWADYLLKIKSVVIGKDITSVGNYAFGYAHNIESVTFEEGSKLEKIGAAAFMYMLHTTEVVIPESVTFIGNNAFSYSAKLAKVVIPQEVATVYPRSFYNCKNLVLNVAVGTYGEEYAVANGFAYETREYVDAIIASGTCGESATWTLYVSGKMVISGSGAMDNYKNQNATPWAAYINKIKSVVIGKDITVIGNYAFAYGYYIESVTFEEGSKLEKVGAVAFHYNIRLVEVVLPETVTSIGNLAFGYSANLTTVVVPEGASVHADAFKKSPKVNIA